MALSRRAAKLAIPGADANALLNHVLANLYDAETYPDGFVNLGAAENTLMHKTLINHIHSNLAIPSVVLTYGDGYKRLRQAAARFVTRYLRPVTAIEPAHVIVSNGCTPAVENLAWAVADPGDGILIGRPYYGSFPSDVGKRTGVDLVPVSLVDLDPMGLAAVQRHEEAIVAAKERGRGIAAIILSHPHNPLGRCYHRDVLVAYMKLCQRHQVHLVSDEIYALSVYDNRVDKDRPPVQFQSLLSVDPSGIIDPRLVHVLWGMSKDFGANGLRMGFTITQHNETLRTALNSVFEFSWTSALSDLVTANVLEDDAWVEQYVRENQRKLSEHHEMVVKWARKHHVEYEAGANAGFFLWVNLGAVYREHHPGEIADVDKAVMDRLVACKVFLASGVKFGAEQAGWFRIVFSRDADYLERGLKRIVDAVTGESPMPAQGTEGQWAEAM